MSLPRGKTDSPYRLRERRQRAFDLFTKGFSNDDVAERLEVHVSTVSRYRQEYDGELQTQVRQNPQLLRNVLENTVRALQELDAVRRAAWEEYDGAKHDITVECECGRTHVLQGASNPTTRSNLLNQITKAQEQRAKLLGLFGVKAEFLMHVQSIRVLQERIIGFMRSELCDADKRKLEELLSEQHHSDVTDMPVLEVGSGNGST